MKSEAKRHYSGVSPHLLRSIHAEGEERVQESCSGLVKIALFPFLWQTFNDRYIADGYKSIISWSGNLIFSILILWFLFVFKKKTKTERTLTHCPHMKERKSHLFSISSVAKKAPTLSVSN